MCVCVCVCIYIGEQGLRQLALKGESEGEGGVDS